MTDRAVQLTLHPDDYELVKEQADQAGITVEDAVNQIFRGMLRGSVAIEKILLMREAQENPSH